MGRRVVITGYGVVAPSGNNSSDFWEGVKEGRNCIDRISHFDLENHKVTMAAEVRDFVYPDKREARSLDLSSQFAIVAAGEALEMSGLAAGENIDP